MKKGSCLASLSVPGFTLKKIKARLEEGIWVSKTRPGRSYCFNSEDTEEIYRSMGSEGIWLVRCVLPCVCVYTCDTRTRVQRNVYICTRNSCIFSHFRGARNKNTRKYTRVAKVRVHFVFYTRVVHACHV